MAVRTSAASDQAGPPPRCGTPGRGAGSARTTTSAAPASAACSKTPRSEPSCARLRSARVGKTAPPLNAPAFCPAREAGLKPRRFLPHIYSNRETPRDGSLRSAALGEGTWRAYCFRKPVFAGFDRSERMAERLAKAGAESYPPHNIEQTSEADLRIISLRYRGFAPADLSVTVEDNQPVIRGSRPRTPPNPTFWSRHRRPAVPAFSSWRDGMEVAGRDLENGLFVPVRLAPAGRNRRSDHCDQGWQRRRAGRPTPKSSWTRRARSRSSMSGRSARGAGSSRGAARRRGAAPRREALCGASGGRAAHRGHGRSRTRFRGRSPERFDPVSPLTFQAASAEASGR